MLSLSLLPTPQSAVALATPELSFRSFFMGGFECSTHVRRDGRRVDVIHSTRHDRLALEDYDLLAGAGLLTVRDGLRWHLIERAAGVYDWSSFLPMLRSSFASGVEVIWDLCHWGVPDGLHVFAPEFPTRFAAFARAAAQVLSGERARAGVAGPNVYTVMNEISFWAWAGGDVNYLWPSTNGKGGELKRQLVRSAVLATRAVREVDGSARFVQPEPMIHIAPRTRYRQVVEAASRHTESQFEVWDMLAGRLAPELGGDESLLDILGVNYYWNNQWVHQHERTPPGHPKHRPVHAMLADIAARYHRPVLIAETGVEASAQIGWLGYMMAEVREAQRLGVRVRGLCLYPVMDYPGWDDERHCPCGLIEVGRRWGKRQLRSDVAAELSAQQHLLRHTPQHR